jgi:hypothetical protein
LQYVSGVIAVHVLQEVYMSLKDKVLQVRLSDIEKKRIDGMAEKAGLSITKYVKKVLLGYDDGDAVPENGHTEVSTVVSSPVSVAPSAPVSDKLADLKAKFGLRPAAALLGGDDARPPEVVKRLAAPRPYAWNRQGFYEILSQGNWWMIQRDRDTGQIWVATTTRQAKEFKTVEEAKKFVDENEG